MCCGRAASLPPWLEPPHSPNRNAQAALDALPGVSLAAVAAEDISDGQAALTASASASEQVPPRGAGRRWALTFTSGWSDALQVSHSACSGSLGE